METDDEYRVHWDRVDPSVDFLEHLRLDAPKSWLLGGVGVGALVLGRLGLGRGVGGLLGGLFALAMLAPRSTLDLEKRN